MLCYIFFGAFMAIGVYCSGLLLNFFPSQIDNNYQLSDTPFCSLTEDIYAMVYIYFLML